MPLTPEDLETIRAIVREEMRGEPKPLAAAINQRVQQVLRDEMRPGGLLNSGRDPLPL